MPSISFGIRPLAPFRLDLTVWALRRRPHNILDRWDGRSYRRVFILRGRLVWAAVEQLGPPGRARLSITAEGAEPEDEPLLAAALQKVLGLRADLGEFYGFAVGQPGLNELVREFRGLKPPCFPTVFETLVNAIVCQQFTLTSGIGLLNRLVESWGPALGGSQGTVHAFPRPEDLAGRRVETLRHLGLSRQKARAIIELSTRVKGGLDLENLSSLEDGVVREHLLGLSGVGRWTAEYVLLRGLGRRHVFPGDDVGARNKLRAWLNLPRPLDYGGVNQVLEPWQPFAGLVYFHLLLHSLTEKGLLRV